MTGNTVHKKIGIQVRSKEGLGEERTFLTGDDIAASYPVLTPLNDQRSIVAYTKKNGDKPYVSYQVISIE
jgi:hypothetical protein